MYVSYFSSINSNLSNRDLCFVQADENDEDIMYAKVLSFHDMEFLMGAHITTDNEAERSHLRDQGLIANHVYSVLNVVCIEGHRLLQLRNPWGSVSWKGSWSDEDRRWTANLSALLNPHRSAEGIFWMDFRDFRR